MKTLVLKTLPKDLKAYGGFQWPAEVGATVTAPDWSHEPKCGNGLHGFIWGEGAGILANFSSDSVWMLVEPLGEIVDLGGKVKFESCIVRDVGTQAEITAKLHAMRPGAIIGLTLTAGHDSTLTAGDGSTLTAGYGSILTAGHDSILTAGHDSILTGGKNSILSWKYWDGERRRIKTVYTGEDVEAGKAYQFKNGNIYDCNGDIVC